MIINIGLMKVESIWLISLLSVVFGFNYFPGPSFFVVYGTQIAFPVDQASVAGYLIAIFHTFGFILGIIFVPFIDDNPTTIKILFNVMGAILLLGAILTVSIKEDLKKDKF